MRLIKKYWHRESSELSSKKAAAAASASADDLLASQQLQQQQADLELELAAMDDGAPHREMAVDVPDSFVARTKTPPRYPPPRPRSQQGGAPNGSASGGYSTPASPPKPVPPPRDHLRIEQDGRLVNRAPPPQLPARSPLAAAAAAAASSAAPAAQDAAPAVSPAPGTTPTRQQLDSIRKYQEQLRKRKEAEEQQEALNRSLRGSRKLQALESRPHGLVNDAYSSADEDDLGAVTGQQQQQLAAVHRVIGYGELVASLQRLQLLLKKSAADGVGSGSALGAQVAAVQTLLLSPQFGRALAVHNRVQRAAARGLCRPPAADNAHALSRDCLEVLRPCKLPEAAELCDLLSRYELDALLVAHDAVVATTEPRSPAPSPTHSAGGGGGVPGSGRGSPPPRHEGNIRIVSIEKTNEPLGATVRNEGEAVIIGRIVRGGAAEKSGLLREGDEILEVNGIEMRGKSVNEVCDILAGMTGTLSFLVVGSSNQPPPPPRETTIIHMKAHFDYDPEEDLYIPCRELGISFQKGDVLHVISQDDPNWWQAYREGEEDLTLAGLIPSKSFQHQRETMKQTIAGDRLTKEGKSKKASTLLCAKKNPKKKKKKPYGSSYTDGGYPLYASATDDYESDEILTYEEVALYYPRTTHRRPVVLIGPPNIGRHELRQRLMEDSERFAAAVPHTSRPRKEGEVDGQDYHFISRAQFEADILARRFVEHGEYERAYYGTSLAAIRAVVDAGKTCVLNLHPQSLRILRASDLKPYVVFVAPPSLEKLRQKKARAGEAYKEEELKDIIEKAREMEDKYGHLFDLIIINNDTDRAFQQLLSEINSLEREPQWVPAAWVKGS
ncbi:protein PALS1-like [Schistocerca americana]|uniref:protein PALS1-like n=1 Tax=Schistocerca americana TaxID=7009 RepID=UPI001F4F8F69|nr:protein PALS1-like [Schistocerca americana]